MKLLCALLVALMGQHAAAATFDCFTVVDPRGEVVYKSNKTPIDLSKNISDVMAATYPGHHLIWVQTADSCVGVDRLPVREAPASTAQADAPAAGTAARLKSSQKAAAATRGGAMRGR